MSSGLYKVVDAINAIGAAAGAAAVKLEDAAAAASSAAAAGLEGPGGGAGGMGATAGNDRPTGGGLSGSGPSWIGGGSTVSMATLIKAIQSLKGRTGPVDMGSGGA